MESMGRSAGNNLSKQGKSAGDEHVANVLQTILK